jgi:uncharacterized protein YhaN
MRFQKLDLIRYGGFADRTLDFGAGAPDLHIIVGENEAGKSTTMAAVADFLFGFPHRKSHDWRFDANLLRVGATLTHGEQRIDAIRRRGRQQTLVTPDDTPVDPALIDAWLGGLDQDAFLRAWSLDHQRLREGGAAMLSLQDDLGQQLLAAASGVTALRTIRDAIDQEAAAIHSPRRGGARTFSRAKEAFTTAQAQLRTDIVTPRAWIEADTLTRQLEAELSALQARSAQLAAERARLERLQRLAGPIAAYRAFETTFDFQTLPALSASDTALFLATQARARDAGQARDAALRERAALAEQEAALPRDPAILDHVEAIDDLLGSRSEIRGLRARQPDLEQATRTTDARCRVLLAALYPKTAHEAPDTLALHLPDPAAREALRRRAQKLHAAWTRYDTARAAADNARRRASESAPPRTADGPGMALDELRAAVRRARNAGDPDSEYTACQTQLADARRIAEDRLFTLAPRSTWTADALRRAVLPPDTATLAENRAQSALQDTIGDAKRTLEQAEAAAAQHALTCTQIMRDAAVVSLADLDAGRARRMELWTAIAADLARRDIPDDIRLNAFHEAMMAADALADRRFETASAAARLTAAEQAHEQAELHARQARTALENRVAALQARKTAWASRLADSGLPPLSPEDLTIWSGERESALAAIAQIEDLSSVLRQIESRRDSAIAWLMPFHARPPGDGALAAWLAATDELVSRAEARSDAALRAEAAARTATRHAEETQTEAEAARADVVRAQEEWHALLETLAIGEAGPERDDPAASDARTVWLERIDAACTAAAERAAAISAHALAARTIAAFEDRLRGTWNAVETVPLPEPETALDALLSRMERARATAARTDELAARLRTLTEAIGDAGRLLEETQAETAPLLARVQPEDLAEAVERADAWRRAQAEREMLLRDIVAGGDGLDPTALLAEAETSDPAAVAAAKQAVLDETTTLEGQIAATAGRLGQARESQAVLRRRAEQDMPGVMASDRLEDARADIVAQAEAYLLVRAQGLILRHAVERRRREAQSPLLARAGALFSRLTLGRYATLHIAHDTDKPVLFAATPDETLVPVGALSQGTLDQLFLALRLSALEQSLDRGQHLPFLADDLFVNFDDARAGAGLAILGEFAQRTQVLFFTHHPHLADRVPTGTHIHRLT